MRFGERSWFVAPTGPGPRHHAYERRAVPGGGTAFIPLVRPVEILYQSAMSPFKHLSCKQIGNIVLA